MLSDQIADFNKILDDLENLEVKMEDEDKALMLLNGFPSNCEQFKDAMLFGRDQTITLEEVQSSIQTKEMQRKQESKIDNNAKRLNVMRGRLEKRNSKSNKHISTSRSQSQSKLKYFHCHKKGNYKKDCP